MVFIVYRVFSLFSIQFIWYSDNYKYYMVQC